MDRKSYLIIEYIKGSNEPLAAKEIQCLLLKDDIKVDIKTIYNQIDKINDFYFPILNTEFIGVKRRTGYFINKDFFADGQLQYIIDSIQFNDQLSSKESKLLIDRLLCFSSIQQQDRIRLEANDNKQDNSLLLNLSTLLQGINEMNNVYFEYVDYKVKDNKIVQVASDRGNLIKDDKVYYCISPYSIVMNAQNYYVLGYCSKRPDKLSIYRVDRMRFLRKHKSSFVEIREQFDMQQEISQSINMFMSNEKIDLKIRFHNSIIREVVNKFGDEYTVNQIGEDYICTIEDVTYSKGLIGWIMMLQDQIQVLEPAVLCKDIKKKIEDMLCKY